LFTVEELALYNATDEGLPILLGILRDFLSLSLFLKSFHLLHSNLGFVYLYFHSSKFVFDVTKGKSHYGTRGGYNHFAGLVRIVGLLNVREKSQLVLFYFV
jgi:hypothetical protein